jgi:serine/threonine protein kinase
MKTVYVNGTSLPLARLQQIAEGGEAEIFDLAGYRPGEVLKLWKQPNHSDFALADKDEAKALQATVALRLALYQKKILEFPRQVPKTLIGPVAVALDSKGVVVGFTMPFVEAADPLSLLTKPAYRRDNSISNNEVVQLFKKLHSLVAELHRNSVVIGDVNPFNVLIKQQDVFLIDADSMSYGGFSCTTFTPWYIDPLICDPKIRVPSMKLPHSEATDWYAYAVLLFESLLLVHPYGGNYKLMGNIGALRRDERPMKRITVFDDKVIKPSVALPLSVLPDRLKQYFDSVLHKDKREPFPFALLENLRWQRCGTCDIEHALDACPICRPNVVVTKQPISAKVTLTTLFETSGLIVKASYFNGGIHFLHLENGNLYRDGATKLIAATPRSDIEYRLYGTNTIVGMPQKGCYRVIDANGQVGEVVYADTYRKKSLSIDSNPKYLFEVRQGQLYRSSANSGVPISYGQMVGGQTFINVGSTFGFAFARTGGIEYAMTFDCSSIGINDRVALPPLNGGELLDARCYFSDDVVWFMTAVRQGGQVMHRASVVSRTGEVLGTAEAMAQDDSWLEDLSGKCAVTLKGSQGNVHCLFSAHDSGLKRIQVNNGSLIEGAEFSDTAGVVSPDCALYYAPEGIYLVNSRSVRLLQIK